MLTRAVAGLKGCRAAVKFPSYPHRQLHCFKAAAESERSSAQVGFWAVAARGAMSEGNEAHDHPGKKGSFGGLKRFGSTEHVQEYGRPSSDVSSSRNTQEGKPSGEPNRFDLPTQAVQPVDSTYDDEFPALGAAPSKPKRNAAAAVVNPSPVLTPVQTPQQSLRTQGGSFSYVPNQRSNTNNITASQPPYHDRGRAGDGGGREGGGRGRRAMDPIEALGRLLTAILRHRAADVKLQMRRDGYVAVAEILKLSMKTMAGKPLNSHTEDDVRQAVKEDRKQRFGLLEEGGQLLIRANQGHSINTVESEVLLKPITSAKEIPVCVHGTYTKFMDQIWEQGLKRMNRNHIHFASGLPEEDGVISGMRGSADILIYLDVEKALKGGMKLYMSENRVILTEGFDGSIPPEYFDKVLKLARPEKNEYVHVSPPSWLKDPPSRLDVETTSSTVVQHINNPDSSNASEGGGSGNTRKA
ncbi:unnamed protein product [Sphagnum troendelagicum]|uniref:2'-phosphotransferase n=1 Tax=Sphagnum troendelagicum TaxID=128251 RepID=A0ABP0UPT6_9BRYO